MPQRSERRKPAARVEELRSFPYASFLEFQDAYRRGLCSLATDRPASLKWAKHGKYTTAGSRFAVTALTMVPALSVLGFIAYAVSSTSWLLLFALPLFAVGFILFHPSMGFHRYTRPNLPAGLPNDVSRRVMAPANLIVGVRAFRMGAIYMAGLGLAWGALSDAPGLVAVTLVLLVIWLSHLAIDKATVRSLTKAVALHEDILCAAWQGGVLAVEFADGRFCLCPRSAL